MANTSISIAEIKVMRDRLRSEIHRLDREKVKALDKEKITERKFREINGAQLECENDLSELNILLLQTSHEEITVGDNSPASKLKRAIAELNEAIGNIEDVSALLTIIADVINGVNQIIGVLTSFLNPVV